ncbi:TonB-dependent receptor [Pseudoalteromonas denitrificans]|uniref:Outer membrane receptor for ferrienterochelin and colicins n=1 Tax=Pseudoalteromonas denitrificans DSM 6059 TaxID=1123010 RepID=A0A1I1TR28_9GAMM|nr:TonB-dependent receptor [Pseudoalteromonas denitrificans]SFD61062.1 Outer membrane receptor for ferrienterochelin and colicins [Pseudoalteromonas denitrificans DSM 6059]
MKMQLRKKILPLAIAVSLGSVNAFANDTASALKGHITGPNGSPAVGTEITIMHVPSGSVKKTTVNASGTFNAKGLRVGGPYKIVVDSDQFEDTVVDNIFLTLGKTYPVKVQLNTKSTMEQIVVTGRPISVQSGGTGPATHFSLSDIENRPSVNRDIKDIVRADPRIYVDEANSGAIQCAGGNPKFNSLTLDGVRMNDNFGLNNNGYPTERMPFSFDAIDQVAVELAPFDVQYGGFTSCNINAVSKSGTNELKGGLFVDYTSDALAGDKIEGVPKDTGNYDEKRYGFNFGMPLIKDKLFLFASYEKLEGSQVFEYNAFGADKVTQATVDRIIDITKTKYDYDPGSLVSSLPVDDEKLLVKLDWNINDDHRASFVYNYNDGFTLSQSDSSSSRLSLSNHFYERGAELQSYVTSIYSNWTDDFSTEVRVGYSKLDNRQISLDNASGFGEFRIQTDQGDVYLGPDDSRQANKLKYDNLSLKFAGSYYLGDHELSFGYEREELDVFNMFVQHNEGEYRFSSIEDFDNGIAARIYYGNASSHNPVDAAGEFKYALNTVYAQDKFDFIDYDMTITFGLRYDWYTSDDLPTFNGNFYERYGFSNQQNLDGVSLLQPRLGINWVYSDQLELRGGIGLYSGGNPNVWISNSYSNDGIRNIQENQRNVQILGPDAIAFNDSGRPGYDIPVGLYNEVGQGTADDSTNVTDPDFDIPSEWKLSLGATYITESDYIFNLDYLYTDKQDSALVSNLADKNVGTAPDGRPVYDSVNHKFKSDFLLTNVDGEDAYSHVLSFAVNKSFDIGIDVGASYAYTVSKDIHPMTNSVAFSNYHKIAVVDPENPELSTSDYEIPHRFTLNVSYSHEYFAGYKTKFNLFGQASQTNPYSYTFSGNTRGLGFNDEDRQLLYVPLENDSKVTYDMSDADIAAFNSWIESEGLKRGEIMDRNSIDGDWWVTFDVKLEQEFAGFNDNHKGAAYFIIKNVGNFLNDDWGVLKRGDSMQRAITAEVVNDQYVYKTFHNPAGTSVETKPSLWEIRLGIKYAF